MLEIRRAAIAFDEAELIELEGIIGDRDETEALAFLQKSVYEKLVRSQQGRLKCHLDTTADSVETFKKGSSS